MKEILKKNNFFFIGIGGTGMSAIAQYLAFIGKNVSGSDRIFNNKQQPQVKKLLEKEKIVCFEQNSSGINKNIDIVVVSTAIENKVPELQKAKKLGLQIVHRAKMLQVITESKKTIAISGTSGKSSTVAMLFHILHNTGISPSLINGAGLVALQEQGKIGNAFAGKGDWLVIEADESDGTLTNYLPEIGVILNIAKDHKEIFELHEIFSVFSKQVKEKLIVNYSNTESCKYSTDLKYDFGKDNLAGFYGLEFKQTGFNISFTVKGIKFEIPTIGEYNMENALAAISVANYLGVSVQNCSEALQTYKGIYRRMQVLSTKKGIIIIDDYAHNPIKIASAIKACQNISTRVIAWFQPHGFVPTKFLRKEFVEQIANVLRNNDEIWMSEIFFAGGTVSKDISANEIIFDIQQKGKNAFFVENRANFPDKIKNKLNSGDIILLMGARDPSLKGFSDFVVNELIIKS